MLATPAPAHRPGRAGLGVPQSLPVQQSPCISPAPKTLLCVPALPSGPALPCVAGFWHTPSALAVLLQALSWQEQFLQLHGLSLCALHCLLLCTCGFQRHRSLLQGNCPYMSPQLTGHTCMKMKALIIKTFMVVNLVVDYVPSGRQLGRPSPLPAPPFSLSAAPAAASIFKPSKQAPPEDCKPSKVQSLQLRTPGKGITLV